MMSLSGRMPIPCSRPPLRDNPHSARRVKAAGDWANHVRVIPTGIILRTIQYDLPLAEADTCGAGLCDRVLRCYW